jgi:hypothetical protein
MILVISTSFEKIQDSGEFFWGSKFFPSIKPFLPDNLTDVIGITEGIIYFNKSNLKDTEALSFKITSSAITSNYFKVKYVLNNKLNYKSYQIRNALKKYLNKNSVLELPFCAAVDENIFYKILDDSSLSQKIDFLQEKNKWNEIYQLFETFQPIEQNQIWNDPVILNKISFAVAKLSECSENLKKKFADKNQLKKFLEEKRKFRKLAIKLRERCIELQPDNASFYANLAYCYYQSALELSTPGGRKDGNLKNDAQKAIELFNKSLQLNPDRITELYRRASLRSEILLPITLFNNDEKLNPDEKIKSAIDTLSQAENDYQKVIDIFENSISDSDSKLYSKKYYVKSLYHLALIHLKKGKTTFDPSLFFSNKSVASMLDEEKIITKINFLFKADDYISKCILEDNTKPQLTNLLEAATVNNFLIGVYKLYIKAVINFYLFLITDKSKYNLISKEFFYKAIETNFPKEMQKQNKLFIFEKIAQLKISEKLPSDAIKLLEPHYKRSKFFPDYAAYTLAVAYLLNKNKNSAEEIINQYCNNQQSSLHKKFQNLKNTHFAVKIEIEDLGKIYSSN